MSENKLERKTQSGQRQQEVKGVERIEKNAQEGRIRQGEREREQEKA